MKHTPATDAMRPARARRNKPAGRNDSSHPPGPRYIRTRAAKIFPVSNSTDGEVGRVPGGKHLNKALKALGFTGNAEFARLAGVTESMVYKYRTGKASPTNKSLDKIVSAIVDAAEARDMYFDPVEFYVKFGLISRDQLEQEPVDEVFVDLIELDRQAAAASDFEHELFRQQLRGLIDLTRERIKRASETRRQTG